MMHCSSEMLSYKRLWMPFTFFDKVTTTTMTTKSTNTTTAVAAVCCRLEGVQLAR